MNLFEKAMTTTALLVVSTVAGAVSITFGGNSITGQGLTTSVAGATVYTFNNGLKPANYSGDGSVLQGSLSGKYATPAGDTSAYLSVAYPKQNGVEFFTAASGNHYNYFGLYWGSIDAYNSLSFYNGSTLLALVTGADVIAAGTTLGDQTASGSNRYVNFNFGSYAFDRIAFTTTGYAFESDNHAFTNVPEPSTITLMGLGLLTIGFVTRRKLHKN